VHLSKHHGLGNDFLVSLADIEPTPVLARHLCDRRRGVGADGLIVGRPSTDPSVDVEMALLNSDGSAAEMSGNGIRCLAQAVVRSRGATDGEVRVATAAGPRRVVVRSTDHSEVCLAEVEMGQAGVGPAWPGPPPRGLDRALATEGVRVETIDLGNPHLVLLARDPRTVDLARFGAELEAQVDGGANVEFIAATPGRSNEIDLTVWERGAGITEACGTGACAGAYVARRWGLVDDDVVVHLPGGDVRVLLGPSITLIGPAAFIADIEVPVSVDEVGSAHANTANGASAGSRTR
jgi:diaminopimelate epimerase